MKKNHFGEKVEKAIRYNKDTDTYTVQFVFSNRIEPSLRAFPTLEDARKYRDAINEEKLKVKIEEDKAKIRMSEKKEVSLLKDEDIYPFNLLEAMNLQNKVIEDETLENALNHLSPREEFCLKAFYADGKTLQAIGDELGGVTRERIRQIVAKALKRLYSYICELKEQNKFESLKKDLYDQREKLIQVFKEKGIISEDIKTYFGDVYFSPLFNNKNIKIEELDFSCRTYNCLKRANLLTINDIINLSEDDLMKIRNMGKKSVKEIQEKLNDLKTR